MFSRVQNRYAKVVIGLHDVSFRDRVMPLLCIKFANIKCNKNVRFTSL